MSIYETVPQIKLSDPLEPLARNRPRDYWMMFTWALWDPKRIDAYITEHIGKRNPDPTQLREFVLLSLGMVTLVSLPVVLLVCTLIWSYLRPALDFASLVQAYLAFATVTIGVNIVIHAICSSAGRLETASSLALLGALLAAVAVPVFLLHWIYGAPWPRWHGVWITLALSILLGITFNTSIVLFDRERQLMRPFLGSVTLLWGVAAIVFMLAVVSPLGADRFFSDTSGRGLLDLAGLLGLAFLAAVVSAYRPWNWVYGMTDTELEFDDELRRVPRVTPVPVPSIRRQLRQWLDMDWAAGLANARVLWAETMQQDLIVDELRYALAQVETDKLIERVIGLCDPESGFHIEELFSQEQRRKLRQKDRNRPGGRPVQATWGSLIGRRRQDVPNARLVRMEQRRKQLEIDAVPGDLAQGEAADIALAGCWYLAKRHPKPAAQAFMQLLPSKTAAELGDVADALDKLFSEEQIAEKDRLALPKRPAKPKRGATWDVIEEFQSIAHRIWVLRHAPTEDVPGQELHGLSGRLMRIGERAEEGDLPALERPMLTTIARDWLAGMGGLLAAQPKPRKLKKFDNPFVYASPVQPPAPIIRRAAGIGELTSLSSLPNARPVILYGARYAGKTSLLETMQSELDHDVFSLYVDLRLAPAETPGGKALVFDALGAPQGSNLRKEGLPYAILDVMFRSSRRSNLPQSDGGVSPFDHCLYILDHLLAYAGIERFVLMLDHCERVLNASVAPTDRRQIFDFLWRLQQVRPHVNVIVATCDVTTVSSGTAQEDFLNGAQFLNLPWLTHDETAKLLQRDRSVFSPYYEMDALAAVQTFTAGHPQLVQLIGHFVVRRLNSRLSQTAKPTPNPAATPVISASDIAQTVADPEFVRIARMYCHNMLDAVVGSSQEMSSIIRLLATPHIDTSPDALASRVYPQLKKENAEAKVRTPLRLLVWSGLVELDQEGQHRLRGELLRRFATS